MFKATPFAIVFALVSGGACQRAILRDADRSVYRLIEDRQQGAIGAVSDIHIGQATGAVARPASMYDFVPGPVDAGVPESFRRRSAPPVERGEDAAAATPTLPSVGSAATTADERAGGAESAADPVQIDTAGEPVAGDESEEAAVLSPDIFSAAERPNVKVFGLADALAYAMRHGRELQNAKEDLYVAALELTLERHLWTPQFVANIQADFADYGQVRDFDRAMSATADLAVSQSLPYGGQVTARLISTLMRDLGRRITSGETGSVILDANIPLFRGAGRVAYESRYVRERELIYAVRTYERFRRSFLVRISADYFNLQQNKATIDNAYRSYLSRRQDWAKAEFIRKMGRSGDVFNALRAQSILRSAEADLVSAKERFASALDRFKIVLGMSVDMPLDILSQEDDDDARAAEDLLPHVDEGSAVAAALRYRLDLITSIDSVDDARRGVIIAKNRILPDLTATGSVALGTDSDRKDAFSYNTERATWRAGLQLQTDDRKRERNDYRRSLITLRRAKRDNEQFADTVRADVRRALRRIDQQEKLRLIQALNVDENALRADAARSKYDLGRASNQDVVDAETDLLDARNRYAAAVASYRNAILEFRLDSGTFRVTDEGRWE